MVRYTGAPNISFIAFGVAIFSFFRSRALRVNALFWWLTQTHSTSIASYIYLSISTLARPHLHDMNHDLRSLQFTYPLELSNDVFDLTIDIQ